MIVLKYDLEHINCNYSTKPSKLGWQVYTFTPTASTLLLGFDLILINWGLVNYDRTGGVARRDTGLLFHIKNLPPTQPIQRFLQ